MRYLIFSIASIVILCSCQKEIDPSIIKESVDSTKTCQLYKTIQGGDTLLVYKYNNKGMLDMVIDSSISIEPTRYQFFYDNQDRVTQISQLDYAYFDVYFTYSGTKMLSATYVDQGNLDDSTILVYEYGSNTRPVKKKTYTVIMGQARSLSDYTTYEYDAKGNLTKIELYWASGELQKTITISYSNEPNYFTDLTYISEFINMLDFDNAIDPEIGWSENAPSDISITDISSSLAETRKLEYVPDNANNSMHIVSSISYVGFPDSGDFTYDFYFNCK